MTIRYLVALAAAGIVAAASAHADPPPLWSDPSESTLSDQPDGPTGEDPIGRAFRRLANPADPGVYAGVPRDDLPPELVELPTIDLDVVWPPVRILVSTIDGALREGLRPDSKIEYGAALEELRLALGTKSGVEEYLGSAVAAAGDSGFESRVFTTMLAEAPKQLQAAARTLAGEFVHSDDSGDVDQGSQDRGHEAAGG